VRFARAIARDGETYRPHWRRWADQEVRLFQRERTRGRADRVYTDTGTAVISENSPGVAADPADGVREASAGWRKAAIKKDAAGLQRAIHLYGIALNDSVEQAIDRLVVARVSWPRQTRRTCGGVVLVRFGSVESVAPVVERLARHVLKSTASQA
jgi:hypothetical protein